MNYNFMRFWLVADTEKKLSYNHVGKKYKVQIYLKIKVTRLLSEVSDNLLMSAVFFWLLHLP